MFGLEEVFQNHDLSLLFLRPPRHRVTCDLIPLAVLKPEKPVDFFSSPLIVTCDLIPLAVLKLKKDAVKAQRALVTCDLIPLAVLKQKIWLLLLHHYEVTCDLIPLAVLKPILSATLLLAPRWSHVTSYRLRY